LNAKDQLKPIDRLYKEYADDKFRGIIVDDAEPELAKFVQRTKLLGPRFNNYDSDTLEYFATRIYELRKD
jgi:hypothetical protein